MIVAGYADAAEAIVSSERVAAACAHEGARRQAVPCDLPDAEQGGVLDDRSKDVATFLRRISRRRGPSDPIDALGYGDGIEHGVFNGLPDRIRAGDRRIGRDLPLDL